MNYDKREIDLTDRCIKFKDMCIDALNGKTLKDRKDLLKAAFEYLQTDEYPDYYDWYLDKFIEGVNNDEKVYRPFEMVD